MGGVDIIGSAPRLAEDVIHMRRIPSRRTVQYADL